MARGDYSVDFSTVRSSLYFEITAKLPHARSNSRPTGQGRPTPPPSRYHAAKTQTCRVADAHRRAAWSLNAGSAHPPSIGEFTLVVDGPTAQTLSANWFLGLA